MSFKFFYTDYATNQSIRSDEPKDSTLDSIIESMNDVLVAEDNFLGLIDDEDNMLQFMVEEDGSILIDLPNNEQKGSLSKTATLAECVEMVKAIQETIAFEDIDGLVFKAW